MKLVKNKMLTNILDEFFPHKLINVAHVVDPSSNAPTECKTRTSRFLTSEGLRKKVEKLEKEGNRPFGIFIKGKTVKNRFGGETIYVVSTGFYVDMGEEYYTAKVTIDKEFQKYFSESQEKFHQSYNYNSA